jgi:enamine deaminase RidA (YjgF/YER057c/UK114 family)
VVIQPTPAYFKLFARSDPYRPSAIFWSPLKGNQFPQVAAPKDGATLPKSVGGQAALVADSLQAALHELGATPADIVMLRIHVVNGTTERFTEAYSQIQKLLNGEMPSVTVLGVQALFTPELQIEVEMTVRVPSTAER